MAALCAVEAALVLLDRGSPKTTTTTVVAVPVRAPALAVGAWQSSATADAVVRASVPLMEAYGADHAPHSYAGASAAGLRRAYDAGLSRTVIVAFAHTNSYCIEVTQATSTSSYTGPRGAVVQRPCN